MSASSPTPASASIAEYQSDLFGNHCINIALTLVGYEYLLTLHHEYDFWRHKWSSATWLFITNRYLMLAVSIDQVMPYTPQTCSDYSLHIFLHALALLPYAVTAVFSALRVYALLNRECIVAGFVLLLGLVPAVINAYLTTRATFYYVDDPVLGSSCFADLSISNSANFYASLMSPLTVVIADIVVVIVTWVKTYSHVRQASALGLRDGVTMSATLLRDGNIYFVALLVLNLGQLLVSVVPAFLDANPLVVILQIVPSILVSRFLINLRKVSRAHREDANTTLSRTSLSQFEANFRARSQVVDTIVGPMGEQLEHGAGSLSTWGDTDDEPACDSVTPTIAEGGNLGEGQAGPPTEM